MQKSALNSRPFISVEDVSLRLYDRVLFEHTRWEIMDDQHWAVVGPNGSGKSTLMKALCGHLPVVKGRITYHFAANGGASGRPGIDARPHDRITYVAFDLQQKALSGAGQFYQSRWNSGAGGDALAVSEYLAEDRIWQRNPYQVGQAGTDPAAFRSLRGRVIRLLDVEALLGRQVRQLSDGERRKVFIARALLKEPRLLILDNPFTGLDQRFRARLREIVERLMEDDMRVMVVTAQPDEIPPGITHVLRVEHHQVVAQGARESVPGDRASPGVPAGPARAPALDVPPQRLEGPARPDSPLLVHMEGVSVSYGGARVLDDIHWSVRRGEHWALLGPNGAGKTTLLSLVLGDHPQAYANRVTLFGRRRGSGESIWEIKRHIGWVAPELHLYYPRQVSCRDVTCSGFFDSVGLYQQCSPRQRETARAWMQYLGVWQYAGLPFADLSEGEQRMVLMARALVKDPLLLVLDEPCQGLDAANRGRVLAAIDAAGSHLDTSVIYVTHETAELPAVITHVIRLEEGRIRDQGPLARLLPGVLAGPSAGAPRKALSRHREDR